MRRYSSNLAFVDLLFNLLVGFTSLFVIAFLMINPISKTGEVTPPIKMFVEVEWDKDLNKDIDLFVRGPDGTIVFFGRKDGNYMTLERDDLGWTSDTYVINGEEITVQRNYEIINFAELPPGEYVIAVFYFSSTGDPVEVKASVRTISPHRVVYQGVVEGLTPRKERTVVSFTVDADGNVGDLNTELQIPLASNRAAATP
jgi:hypothetical protein